MKLYKSCGTLPIKRFFRIFDNEDLRNLVIGFDEENDEFSLTVEQINEFEEIFDSIFYEYSDISENHKLRSTLVKKRLISEWEFIYTMITSIVNLYLSHKQPHLLLMINEIEEPGYFIDDKKPLEPQIIAINQKLKGLKNKIKIFKLKLSVSLQNNKKKVKVDLDRDALYLERNLELKRAIDPETTSVKSWVRMIQMDKQKSKGNGINKNNKQRSRRSR